jgi:hypothetical protein
LHPHQEGAVDVAAGAANIAVESAAAHQQLCLHRDQALHRQTKSFIFYTLMS